MSDRRAAQHRAFLAALAALTGVRVRRLWRDRLDLGDVYGSWWAALPAVRMLLWAAVTAAVQQAEPYVAGMVSDAGEQSDPVGRVQVQPFLDGVTVPRLAVAAARMLRRIGDGDSPQRAAGVGEWLAGAMARDIVADAGRDADLVALAAEPAVTGYVRVVNPPVCGRCAILAGRVYRVSEFLRHPQCDCGMRPVVRGQQPPRTFDPGSYFASLAEPDQNRLFGAAQADAIRGGADVTRAVNAAGSMWRPRRSGVTLPDLLAGRRGTVVSRLMDASYLAA